LIILIQNDVVKKIYFLLILFLTQGYYPNNSIDIGTTVTVRVVDFFLKKVIIKPVSIKVLTWKRKIFARYDNESNHMHEGFAINDYHDFFEKVGDDSLFWKNAYKFQFHDLHKRVIRSFFLSYFDPGNITKAIFIPKQLAPLILGNFILNALGIQKWSTEFNYYIGHKLLSYVEKSYPPFIHINDENHVNRCLLKCIDISEMLTSTMVTWIFFKFCYPHLPELLFLKPIKELIESHALTLHDFAMSTE